MALQRLQGLLERLRASSSVVGEASSTAREAVQLAADSQDTGESRGGAQARPAPTRPLPVCSANRAQQKLGEAERRAERLMEQVAPLSMLGETLNRNLSDIRELIQQARRQAASVHTHTHTGGGGGAV